MSNRVTKFRVFVYRNGLFLRVEKVIAYYGGNPTTDYLFRDFDTYDEAFDAIEALNDGKYSSEEFFILPFTERL